MQSEKLPVRSTGPVEISVIMPCYNESGSIESSLREWESCLAAHASSFEIIVINNGSKDGTGRILDRLRKDDKALRVIHQLHVGLGQALRRGFEMARGRYILQASVSGGMDPEEFQRLWEARLENHLVLGRRTRRIDGLVRELGSHCLHRLVRFLFKSQLQDPATPFRLFRREAGMPVLAELPASIENVDLAMSLFIEHSHPGQVTEVPVPVRLKRRLGGRQGFVTLAMDAIQVIEELLKLRFRLATLRLSLTSRKTISG